jgi:hypothetical protein
VAFGGGGAGMVVTDDAAQVLHHKERGRKVRWGSRRARRGTASGSPVKADSGGVSREIGERKQGTIVCGRRADFGKDGRGERDGGQRLSNALGHAVEGKRGRQGVRGGRRVEGGNGKEEGARAQRRTARAAGIAPGHRARAVALPRDSGGRRGAVADKWGWVTAGPGG